MLRLNYLWIIKLKDPIGRLYKWAALSECEYCMRNNKVREFNDPVLALEADIIFDFIQADYIFGLPESDFKMVFCF